MDRFAEGLRDMQSMPITGECECEAELYDDSILCPECEELSEMEGEE